MAGSGGGDASQLDHIKMIPIGSGDQLVQYDFCEVPPSELAGWVFIDNNGDCEIQPDEKGIANVRMELYNANGQLVATTFTNSDGSYSFKGWHLVSTRFAKSNLLVTSKVDKKRDPKVATPPSKMLFRPF